MNLQQFLLKARDNELWLSRVATCFVHDAPDDAMFFLSTLFTHLGKISEIVVQPYTIEGIDQQKVLATLSCSFLGTRSLYWLKKIHSLDTKKRDFWYDFLARYEGPHNLIVCMKPSSKLVQLSSLQLIQLEDIIDMNGMNSFISFFLPEMTSYQVKDLSRELFKRRKKISLNMASLVVRFVQAIGFDMVIIRSWLDDSFLQEQSLFTLSGYFFARNAQSFFKVWSSCALNYPEIFWVSYWFDTFWRAYHFIRYMQDGQVASAKKIAFRLPFSFIQRDWKLIQLHELKHALELLSTIDSDLKRGSQMSYAAFEVVYLQFFYALQGKDSASGITRRI